MDIKNLRDGDSQPVIQFRDKQNQSRSVDELIRICKGIVADGQVVQAEAEFLLNWFYANRMVADEYPGNYIYPRLAKYLDDGCLNDEESLELKQLLLAVTGESNDLGGQANMTTTLPIDNPLPKIIFRDKSFCFTGALAFGLRKEAEKIIVSLGGQPASSITKKLDYLVLGCMSSRDWKHTTHGLKIQKAVGLRDNGCSLAIISEDYWIENVKAAGGV